ncbi:MAG: ABC transporter ATP-binding protein/permease [Cyanobacteria bacterium]|nr:ABC transporter ATP-binding protein/permease [Cyanobacteriota bacterium]
MIGDLKSVLSWLPARERLRWLLLVPVAAFAAIVEATGALAVFGLLRLVVDPVQVQTAPVVSYVWRVMGNASNERAVVALLTLFVGIFYVLRAAFLSWAEWLRHGIIYRSSAVTAERLLARYLAADYLFHARRRSASLIEPITRASDIAFELVAGSAVNILAEVVIILALSLVLLFSAPPITLITVAIVLGLVLIPIVLTRRSWERIGESERQLYQQQLHLLNQSIGAIKDVKVTGRQPFFEERFRHLKRDLGTTKQRRAWAAALARLGVEATLIVSMLLVVFLVMRQDTSGVATVSVLALFAYTGFRVVPSANRIMLNVGYMREAHPWIRSMDDDMRKLRVPPARPYEHDRPLMQATLACENVSFGYEGGPPWALDNVSFTIERGQSVGIVGPTGAGKSTLVDVLLGLLPPTTGRVLIDGEPLEGRERAWQRQIGYVPQDVYLLDDSLRRNIAFGIPDGAIDESRLAAAVTQARLDEVVAALPAKLETIVGENGFRLSGGQRQRVAIARALYHDPPVLFFDEATAALDNQTEREVTEAIANVHGRRTVIAIAHRLSTVKNCDRLIYLRDGKLGGLGTYSDLISDPGFRQLT